MKKNILIILAAFCAWVALINLSTVASTVIPLRSGYVHSQFPWANFDGIHYLNIAARGYVSDMRFMPFFPLIVHVFGVQTDYFWAAFLLVHLSLLLALIFAYKLFHLDFSPRRSLFLTLILLMLPASFFYGMIYTESIFLLFTVLAFYAARRGKWLWAALFGICASSTRIVGFLIVVPLLIEFFMQKHTKKVHHLLALLLVPLGTALYALYNYIQWGNPFLFIQAHSQLSNGRSSTSIVLFPQTMYRYFKMLTTVSISLWEWKIALVELVLFSAALVALYMLWKMKVRTSYLIYTLLNIAVPASSGTFTGLPRYLIVLFPLVIPFLAIRNKTVLGIVIVLMFLLQLILLSFFWRGYYVA
jgi:hypothetical protein